MSATDLVVVLPCAALAWLVLAGLLVGWEAVAVRVFDRIFGAVGWCVARVRGVLKT